jgi:hypothetical protein
LIDAETPLVDHGGVREFLFDRFCGQWWHNAMAPYFDGFIVFVDAAFQPRFPALDLSRLESRSHSS